MNRKSFFLVFIGLNVFLVFFKIYQHNLIVKILYKKQKIEREVDLLTNEKNNLLVRYNKLRDPKVVYEKAKNDFGFARVPLNKFLLISEISKVDGGPNA
ncbi:TPA: hypothetical protein DEO28_00985 [Candidatus Dependentiae bacterium]|nr:MAG: hypothetical protein UR14_C0003G0047 [candidate division TM6 bacterium GW2011_GWE2_31_21]KKP54167.1 MAG: hypothetical protein UR43_C0001G0185 [candidate division TM6 bacterium GW2011_GWF2_33_332]HBS47889.1 hypothetical protein [Candidatus Dependentiae bacterium]HBZ73074.1 hypothetical protein [Candidatus Dependentiae bacterium]